MELPFGVLSMLESSVWRLHVRYTLVHAMHNIERDATLNATHLAAKQALTNIFISARMQFWPSLVLLWWLEPSILSNTEASEACANI